MFDVDQLVADCRAAVAEEMPFDFHRTLRFFSAANG